MTSRRRRSCSSLMIAAGLNAKALSTFMGHSSVATTFDRYGHPFPGNEAEAASLLEAYLQTSRGLAGRGRSGIRDAGRWPRPRRREFVEDAADQATNVERF